MYLKEFEVTSKKITGNGKNEYSKFTIDGTVDDSKV
jgi:hypothetical protein